MGLKEEYEKDGITFTISQHSTPKTQLCTKILTSGFFEDLIQFTENVQESEEWNFESLYKDDKKKAEFRKWYIKQKAQEYNIDEDKIVMTKIKKGSLKVEWTTVNYADALSVLKKNHQQKKLKLHPYFQHFSLSPEDFDVRGNI